MAKDNYQRYNDKTVRHTVRINPQTEPIASSRLMALKKAGQAAAFFKDALVEYKTEDETK